MKLSNSNTPVGPFQRIVLDSLITLAKISSVLGPISRQMCIRDSYQPMDKAGAYGVQEWIGYIGVKSISGSFYNIMGLPICLLYTSQTADGIKAQVKDNRSYNYKWENILTYNFQIKKVHDITLTAVTSWNHNRSDVTTLYQKGVSDNKMCIRDRVRC